MARSSFSMALLAALALLGSAQAAQYINIFTAADYQNFLKTGPAADTQAITIFPSSGCVYPNCDLLSYASSVDTTFRDSIGNIIRTTRSPSTVQAVYSAGQALLERLPKGASTYAVNVNCGAFVNSTNIDAITKWTHATSIEIADNSNIAFALLQRIAVFSGFTNLYLAASSH